jgi:ADP-ribosylglycohydrolase
MDQKQLTGRFIGSIVGFAVGDALGMPTQFLTRDQIRRYYGKPVTGFLRAHPGHASDSLWPPPNASSNAGAWMQPDRRRRSCPGTSTVSRTAPP